MNKQRIETSFETASDLAMSFVLNIGPLAMPLAVAVFMMVVMREWAENQGLTGGWFWITVLAPLIALEITGIASGHLLAEKWLEKGTIVTSALAGLALYVFGGIAALVLVEIVLTDSPSIDVAIYGSFFFLAAGTVYVLYGEHRVKRAVGQRQVQARQDAVAQSRQDVGDERQARHQQRLLNLEIEAGKEAIKQDALDRRAARTSKKQLVTSPVTSGHLPGDFRLLTDQQKTYIASITTRELEQVANISGSTARRWKRQVPVNGDGK